MTRHDSSTPSARGVSSGGSHRGWQRGAAAHEATRPRAGWLVALTLFVLALLGVLVFVTAWVIGGRALPQINSVQSLLPQGSQSSQQHGEETLGDGAASVPLTSTDLNLIPVDASDATLPGAPESTQIQQIPLDSLNSLKSLGWSVPHLSGFGLSTEYAETGVVEGIRTVQLRLTDGEHRLDISETRPEETGVELAALESKLDGVVDTSATLRETLTLRTGDACELYVSEEAEEWTAAMESGRVQYVVTSDLPADTAEQISNWVMATDRSRVQVLPIVPTGSERLERGFEELLAWLTD
ncbi:hypothetical protein LTH96_01355 [Nesterenkonia sp. LB17]|uniref:hypothetical protein n=1 Tax=unclassified Nesterenkonia TaxID=2629769 RepID=UPI001F4CD356|nr:MULTISPECIES: hypothetical protein [unclassified Nesterenkonia]MCH8559902.1 hypothetical protein [Nesterenkonia sp. DZ6]MCH8562082.1 hypothetical protein [Nesterenkonia sp. YGD6]MCH8564388.1 hypothetical protein [Nesterenkonia sp. LB17]MCH8570014.1 hypothetical protein [Nesterenkonia sp. AY15]